MTGKKMEVRRDGMTHEAIGRELGISRSMVYLIERQALAKLLRARKLLTPYLKD